jgi:hypothetical protein
MNYCNGVQSFINYALSNPINISGGDIRYPYRRCKNKKFLNLDVVIMHLLKKMLMEIYLCWFVHRKPYVPHKTMIKRMVESTSSFSNVHGVVDDNSNPYRNIVMDAMRIDQDYADQHLIAYEEPNTDATRFFYFLKEFGEPLWDGCTNHSKLSVVAHVFTIKLDHGLSEIDYDIIVEYVKSILPERNRLKKTSMLLNS